MPDEKKVVEIVVIETNADASATDERKESNLKPGKKLKLREKMTIEEIEALIRRQ